MYAGWGGVGTSFFLFVRRLDKPSYFLPLPSPGKNPFTTKHKPYIQSHKCIWIGKTFFILPSDSPFNSHIIIEYGPIDYKRQSEKNQCIKRFYFIFKTFSFLLQTAQEKKFEKEFILNILIRHNTNKICFSLKKKTKLKIRFRQFFLRTSMEPQLKDCYQFSPTNFVHLCSRLCTSHMFGL